MKTALITGISGQDGSYLSELLLSKGYQVHGIQRVKNEKSTLNQLEPTSQITGQVNLHDLDLNNYSALLELFETVSFDECYHLAANSFVNESLEDGLLTMNNNINGSYSLLTAIKNIQPNCRCYFAGSSEMFGNPPSMPQDETTPFNPRNPYGISKVAGYYLNKTCREKYDMFCSAGILYNHESPRRNKRFVTRKITLAAANIYLKRQENVALGNLDAQRDWGHAADYVKAMHSILQADQADDFVIATGTLHSVRDFCQAAFTELGLDYQQYVVQDERFFREEEKILLHGNPKKAKQTLNWEPEISFEEMVKEMVRADLALLQES